MVKSARKKVEPQASSRLGAEDWVRAGLEILATQGIDAVRVEPLARMLSVTKGSFYWHFNDRAALLEAMLDYWRRRSTLAIIDRLESSAQPPRARLHTLIGLSFGGPKSEFGVAIDLGIRLWGRTDVKARQALAEIDELRIKYFARLIAATGVPPKDAHTRAVLAYCYMRVAPSLPAHNAPSLASIESILFPS